MTRLILAPRVRDDFDCIFDFLIAHARDYVSERIEAIIAAIGILETSPLIGRPAVFGQRELVIVTGANGYQALYRYDPVRETVFVLAVRSQRERHCKP